MDSSACTAATKQLPALPSEGKHVKLELDYSSRQHLELLLLQCLQYSGLKENLWKDSLFGLIDQIVGIISPELLAKLLATRQCLRSASAQGQGSPVIRPSVSKESLQSETLEDDFVDVPSSESSARQLLADLEKGEKHETLPKLDKLVWTFRASPSNSSEPRQLSFERDSFKGALLLHSSDADAVATKEDKAIATFQTNYSLHGGQFTLKAPHSEIGKLSQILEVLLFATTHLLLEIQLYANFGISRPAAPPPELPPKLNGRRRPSLHLVMSRSSEGQDSPVDTASPTETSKRNKRSSVWSLLRGRSDSNDSTDAQPKPYERVKQKLKLYRDRSRTLVPSETSPPIEQPIKPRKRRLFGAEDWEIIAPDPASSTEQSENTKYNEIVPTHTRESTTSTITAVSEPSLGRIARVVDRMSGANLSVSPEIATYPPPHLLQRLKQQESGPALSNKRKRIANGSADTSESSEQPDAHVISRDSKAGMAYMQTNNNSLNGIIKHQAISFLAEKVYLGNSDQISCTPPQVINMPFYRFDSNAKMFVNGRDLSLAGAIEDFVRDSTTKCSSCKNLSSDHSIRLSHSNVQAEISLSLCGDNEEKRSDTDSDRVSIWMSCKACNCKTPPTELEEAAGLVSFAKFIELCMYTGDQMFDKSQLECQAACKSIRHRAAYHFRKYSKIVSIALTEITLYEVRFPTSLTDTLAMGKGESNSVGMQNVTADILALYASLEEEVTALRKTIVDLSDEQEKTLEKINTDFSVHRDDLLERGERSDDALKLRSSFANYARVDKETLSNWQQKYAPDFTWPSIEPPIPYLAADALALPESAIIVKEQSPSTFLAYALTSSSFLAAFEKAEATSSIDNLGTAEPAMEVVSVDTSPTIEAQSSLTPRKVLDTGGSRFLRAFNAVGGGESENLVKAAAMEFEVTAKAKRPRVHQASNPLSLRMVKKSKSSDAFSVSSGSTLMSTTAVKHSSSQDQTLDQLVVSKEKKPLHVRSNGQLPGLITSLAKRGHQAEVSTSTALATPTREIDHSRAFSAGSRLSTNSSLNVDDATISSVSTNRSRFLTSPLSSIFNLGKDPTVNADSKQRLHIKVSIKSAQRRISVVVWFAKEFDQLRRHCGISQADFVKAMSDSIALQTDGGKSKAHFFTSLDGKYILKELVPGNWAGLERDSMLEFGNSGFFEHFSDSIAPSVLSKIFAFFTIKIKVKGSVITKDIIVLENIFPQPTAISQKFDLKGIAKRKCGEDATVKMDSEWMQLHRHRALLHPHCRTLLDQAIGEDTKFLAIYHRLFAIARDRRRTQRTVLGIIDILSAFSVGKALENAAKRALNSGRSNEVTVLPPHDYAERFKTSMLKAFICVPDKWTASDLDPNSLPSVI